MATESHSEVKKFKTNDIQSLMDEVSKLNADEIIVLGCKYKDDRKLLHNFIETHYRYSDKASLYISSLPYLRSHVLMKCIECNRVVKLSYSRGIMDNNKDESYTGTCSDCGAWRTWECNFDYIDDDTFCKLLPDHNAIVFGASIAKLTKVEHTHEIVTCDVKEIDSIINKCALYKLQTNRTITKASKYQKYIGTLLSDTVVDKKL